MTIGLTDRFVVREEEQIASEWTWSSVARTGKQWVTISREGMSVPGIRLHQQFEGNVGFIEEERRTPTMGEPAAADTTFVRHYHTLTWYWGHGYKVRYEFRVEYWAPEGWSGDDPYSNPNLNVAVQSCGNIQGSPHNSGGKRGQSVVDASWILSSWHDADHNHNTEAGPTNRLSYMTGGIMGNVESYRALDRGDYERVLWRFSAPWGNRSGSIQNSIPYPE
jgi:hypothetical protein